MEDRGEATHSPVSIRRQNTQLSRPGRGSEFEVLDDRACRAGRRAERLAGEARRPEHRHWCAELSGGPEAGGRSLTCTYGGPGGGWFIQRVGDGPVRAFAEFVEELGGCEVEIRVGGQVLGDWSCSAPRRALGMPLGNIAWSAGSVTS